MTVKGDTITCEINNRVVASYDRSALVMAGKLKSTGGVHGIRFAHNTDATATNFKKTKARCSSLTRGVSHQPKVFSNVAWRAWIYISI